MGKYLALCTHIPYQTGMVNDAMNHEMVKITVAPYQAGTVNHATNNETAKIKVTPFQAGSVNYATMNKMTNITDTMLVWHVRWTPSMIQTNTD